MKRTLLSLALVAAAGTAGAQTVTTPSVGGAQVTPPAVGGGAATVPPTAAPSATTPAVPSKSIGAGGATATTPSVGSTTVTPPTTGAAGVTTPGINPPSVSTPGVPSQSISGPNTANLPNDTSAQAKTARKRIEADGYKNVQNLQKGADGLYHGTALRGNSQVQVTVDRTGNVLAK